MPIKFRCSHCRQLLSISSRKAGTDVECPACGEAVTVPHPEQEAETPGGQSPRSEEGAGATGPAEESAARSATSAKDGDAEDDDGFTLRSPETDLEEMDLTPMVDVTFLLLIFFMITASFSLQKSIEVPRPDPNEKGATQTIQNMQDLLEKSVQVEIDEQNVIYVDGERLNDPAGLTDRLREAMGFDARSGRRTELVLDADPRALHQTVVQVIDAAHEVGMQRIRLMNNS